MIKIFITSAIVMFLAKTVFAFEIDFSRRKPFMKSHEMQSHSMQTPSLPQPTSVEAVKANFEASQDIVILNTEKGFVLEPDFESGPLLKKK